MKIATINTFLLAVFLILPSIVIMYFTGGKLKKTASKNEFTLVVHDLDPQFYFYGACSFRTAGEKKDDAKRKHQCTGVLRILSVVVLTTPPLSHFLASLPPPNPLLYPLEMEKKRESRRERALMMILPDAGEVLARTVATSVGTVGAWAQARSLAGARVTNG